MKFEDLKYLAVPLPEDIMKEKWSGNFDRVRMIIRHRLENEELSHVMRCRMEYELDELERFEHRYTLTREEALRQLQEQIPDFTEEELDQLHLENKMDWIYLNGEVRYLGNAVKSLMYVYPDMRERTENKGFGGDPEMNAFIDTLEHGQESIAHIHIRHELHLKEKAVEEGKRIHIHLPVPVERDQVHNMNIINIQPEPVKLPDVNEAHPCAYMIGEAKEGKICEVEYEFDNVVTYTDWTKLDYSKVMETEFPEDVLKYTEEKLPHIAFTPYIKELVEEIKDGEENLFLVAKKLYDYVTAKLMYRFAREYASIDCIAEFCTTNKRGDCGMMALTFITLCRAAGIPARWQSGLDARPNRVGEHDWSEIYIPSLGWLKCDPSRGGDAYRRSDIGRWNYYFCNVDPFRIPLTNDFQQQFVPPKKFARMDPYDNQTGELEYDHRGLYESDRSRKYFDLGNKLVK